MLLWQASELTCSRSRYVGARANLENYDLTIRIGNPVDTIVMLANLMFSGRFDELRDLKIVRAERQCVCCGTVLKLLCEG